VLTPAAYDRAELLAEQGLPNRLIQACRPVLFNYIGYPTRAASSGALWRWADAMHEGRFEDDFNEKLGGLTQEEWSWWRQISRVVRSLTNGHPVTPRGALARATIAFRALRARAAPPALVVEVGPGSGYLSALLGLTGYTVMVVENAQAFYLWQNRIFAGLFADKFVDLVTENRESYAGCVVHVPWWRFYLLDPAPLEDFPVDAVAANHVLCEMHKDAAAYLARLTSIWGCPLLVEGWGLETLNGSEGVKTTLDRHQVIPAAVEGTERPSNLTVALAEVLAWQTELAAGPPPRSAPMSAGGSCSTDPATMVEKYRPHLKQWVPLWLRLRLRLPLHRMRPLAQRLFKR
jgi:hypothetical protein